MVPRDTDLGDLRGQPAERRELGLRDVRLGYGWAGDRGAAISVRHLAR